VVNLPKGVFNAQTVDMVGDTVVGTLTSAMINQISREGKRKKSRIRLKLKKTTTKVDNLQKKNSVVKKKTEGWGHGKREAGRYGR